MSQKMQNQSEAEDHEASGQGSGPVQGEGDYAASQRYRDEVSEFLEHADVEGLAKRAAPESALEARELALAQEKGASRSKGDDPADIGAMYPGRKDR
jgi:hypothetical protein